MLRCVRRVERGVLLGRCSTLGKKRLGKLQRLCSMMVAQCFPGAARRGTRGRWVWSVGFLVLWGSPRSLLKVFGRPAAACTLHLHEPTGALRSAARFGRWDLDCESSRPLRQTHVESLQISAAGSEPARRVLVRVNFVLSCKFLLIQSAASSRRPQSLSPTQPTRLDHWLLRCDSQAAWDCQEQRVRRLLLLAQWPPSLPCSLRGRRDIRRLAGGEGYPVLSSSGPAVVSV